MKVHDEIIYVGWLFPSVSQTQFSTWLHLACMINWPNACRAPDVGMDEYSEQ
jgi:hypothetical protein